MIEQPSGVVIFQENNEDSSIWPLLFQLCPYVHKSTLKNFGNDLWVNVYKKKEKKKKRECLNLHRAMVNMENIVRNDCLRQSARR